MRAGKILEDGSRRGSLALSSTYSLAAKRGSCASVLDGISGQHSNAGYDQDEESQLAANTTTTTHVTFTENETRKVDEDENDDSDDDGIGIYPVDSVGDNGVDGNPSEMEEDEILIYPFEEHETGAKKKDDAGNEAYLKIGPEQQGNETQGVPDEMRQDEDRVLGSSYDNLGKEALNKASEDKATSKGENSIEGLAKDHVDSSKEGDVLQKSCAEDHNNPIDDQKVTTHSEDESAIRMLDELFAGLEDDDEEEDHADDERNTEMKEVDDANESCTEHDDSSDDDDVSDDEKKGQELGRKQDDESEDDDEENSEDSDEETEEENSEDSDEVDAENDSSDHQNDDDLQLSRNDNEVDEIANKIWDEIWDDTRHDIGERIKCEKPQHDELVETHQENQKVNIAVNDRSDAGHVSNAYKDENMNAVAKSRKLSTTAVAREMGNI